MTRKEMIISRVIALISSVMLSLWCYCFIKNIGRDIIWGFMMFFAFFILVFDSLINVIKNRNRRGNIAGLLWGIDGIILFLSVFMVFLDFEAISREVIFYVYMISFFCFIFFPCVSSHFGSDLWKK